MWGEPMPTYGSVWGIDVSLHLRMIYVHKQKLMNKKNLSRQGICESDSTSIFLILNKFKFDSNWNVDQKIVSSFHKIQNHCQNLHIEVNSPFRGIWVQN